MSTHKLRAGVQYDDWRGTAAADDADKHDLRGWLKAKNLMRAGEFLVGLEMFAGENHGGKHSDPIYCHALFVQQGDFDTVKEMIDAAKGPVFVRRVDFQLDALEFLALFKRFSIAMSWKHLLPDHEYTYLDMK
jgi:hypothetical protein